MKIPSEPIRKERICQNLTEAFGEELGFSIYYCKADPPPFKKKNRGGGPPFTIVDVTLYIYFMLFIYFGLFRGIALFGIYCLGCSKCQMCRMFSPMFEMTIPERTRHSEPDCLDV